MSPHGRSTEARVPKAFFALTNSFILGMEKILVDISISNFLKYQKYRSKYRPRSVKCIYNFFPYF
jgi:hypothetical protein